jgi:Asp-tRNA(Asn)/Glu-tRNA(Gln) amidotransferase A subunit family amidase
VTVAKKTAREEARRAAEAVEAGERLGPLHGVPVAIKDLVDVGGLPTTRGSKLFEDAVAGANDPVVDRLVDAGAIVIGKTNTPEFGLGCTTDNRVVGPTGTPFDPSKTAGGSSGGAAAALADRLAPIAQGTDTGGSIWTPASCCNVFGLKPSFGRVPRVGRPNGFADHTPFSHTGPLTRTVEDAALMLDVMAGSHPRDPFSLPDSDTDYLAASREPIDEFRVAYSPDLGTYPVSESVRAVVDDAVEAFEAAGATVERADPPLDLDQSEILDAFYAFAKVRWQALFDGLESDHGLDPRGADKEKLRPITVETILESDPVSTREYKAADRVRTQVYDASADLLECVLRDGARSVPGDSHTRGVGLETVVAVARDSRPW